MSPHHLTVAVPWDVRWWPQLTQDGRTFYFRNGAARVLFETLNRADKADVNWAARSA